MKALITSLSIALVAVLGATSSNAQDVQNVSLPSLSFVYSTSAVVTFNVDARATTTVRTTPVTKGCTSHGGSSCTLTGLVQGTKYRLSITQNATRWILNMTMPLNINLNHSPQDLGSTTANKSRAAFLAQLALAPSTSPNFQYIVDPTMPAIKVKTLKLDLISTANFWNSLRPSSLPTRIYLGTSLNFQWIYDNLSKDLTPAAKDGGWLEYKLARSKIDGAGFNGGASPGYGTDGTAVLFYNSGFQSLGDPGWTAISAHEYTHVMQRYVLSSMGPMLCWMREGHAVYSGINLGNRASTAAFRNAWSQGYSNFMGDPSLGNVMTMSANSWKNWFIANESVSPSQCDSYINYLAGSLAFQYLYGTYGWQAVNNFFTNLLPAAIEECDSPLQKNSELSCPSWKTAYRRAFGVSPVSDYTNISNFAFLELKWMAAQKPLMNELALQIAPPAALSKK
jgi:hypothetical protein